MTTQHPFISTRGLHGPIAEANEAMFPDIVEVEPTPQEKFDSAMDVVERYAKAVHRHAQDMSGENLADVLSTHDDLFKMFWDQYGLGRE